MSGRILVADKLPAAAIAELRALGLAVEDRPDLTAEALVEAVRGVRILIVRSTRVTRAALEAADTLALVVRAGSGVNTIDVDAASERGICVANCPGQNSVAVAELALGLVLALDRRIPEAVADLRAGRWNKALYARAEGLEGKRLGLVGFGAIAREVAARARGFELQVQAFARSLTAAEAERARVALAPSLEAVFATSDIVSLHLPLTRETRGLVDARLIGLMKPQAMLINTARAELVDAAAVLSAARAGAIRVGTDVFAEEPEGSSGPFLDPLGAVPGVVGTHHIGASTEQAQRKTASAAVRIVSTFLRSGEVLDAVNILHSPPVQGTLVVRHLDRVGVLASVFGALRNASINVETMENVIFAGKVAACARIRLAERPSGEVVQQIAALDHVISVELI